MITIYRTKHCPYCVQVKNLCEKYGAKYKVVELDDDPKLRDKLIKKTGFTTVPITTDGVSYIAGWQPYLLVPMIRTQNG